MGLFWGEANHDVTEDFRVKIRPEMAESCSSLLVIQSNHQINLSLHWKENRPIFYKDIDSDVKPNKMALILLPNQLIISLMCHALY